MEAFNFVKRRFSSQNLDSLGLDDEEHQHQQELESGIERINLKNSDTVKIHSEKTGCTTASDSHCQAVTSEVASETKTGTNFQVSEIMMNSNVNGIQNQEGKPTVPHKEYTRT